MHYNVDSDLLDYVTNKEMFAHTNGFAAIPQGPGLGIVVNEEVVRERAKIGHNWKPHLAQRGWDYCRMVAH